MGVYEQYKTLKTEYDNTKKEFENCNPKNYVRMVTSILKQYNNCINNAIKNPAGNFLDLEYFIHFFAEELIRLKGECKHSEILMSRFVEIPEAISRKLCIKALENNRPNQVNYILELSQNKKLNLDTTEITRIYSMYLKGKNEKLIEQLDDILNRE